MCEEIPIILLEIILLSEGSKQQVKCFLLRVVLKEDLSELECDFKGKHISLDLSFLESFHIIGEHRLRDDHIICLRDDEVWRDEVMAVLQMQMIVT